MRQIGACLIALLLLAGCGGPRTQVITTPAQDTVEVRAATDELHRLERLRELVVALDQVSAALTAADQFLFAINQSFPDGLTSEQYVDLNRYVLFGLEAIQLQLTWVQGAVDSGADVPVMTTVNRVLELLDGFTTQLGLIGVSAHGIGFVSDVLGAARLALVSLQLGSSSLTLEPGGSIWPTT